MFISSFSLIHTFVFRPSFDWMRQMTVRNQAKNKIVSLGFNNIESQTLAAQLTYLEWKILRRITFTDYKTYAIKNTLQDNPRLERSIQFFNGLSTWIQCMVLSKMTPKQRAEIIHKFLEVAKVSC
jgi:RAS guanyl-releasing protein 3